MLAEAKSGHGNPIPSNVGEPKKSLLPIVTKSFDFNCSISSASTAFSNGPNVVFLSKYRDSFFLNNSKVFLSQFLSLIVPLPAATVKLNGIEFPYSQIIYDD